MRSCLVINKYTHACVYTLLEISTVRRLLTSLDVKVVWSIDFDHEMSSHVTRRRSCVVCLFRLWDVFSRRNYTRDNGETEFSPRSNFSAWFFFKFVVRRRLMKFDFFCRNLGRGTSPHVDFKMTLDSQFGFSLDFSTENRNLVLKLVLLIKKWNNRRERTYMTLDFYIYYLVTRKRWVQPKLLTPPGWKSFPPPFPPPRTRHFLSCSISNSCKRTFYGDSEHMYICFMRTPLTSIISLSLSLSLSLPLPPYHVPLFCHVYFSHLLFPVIL